MKKNLTLLAALLCGLSVDVAAQQPVHSAEQLYTEGRQLFNHTHYAAAKESLAEFIKLVPHEISQTAYIQEAEYMLACAAYELKESNSLQILQAYIEQYPDTPHANRLNVLMGNILYAKGDYRQALEHYNQSELDLLANTERDEATLNKGICLLETNQTDEAYRLFTVLQICSTVYQDEALYYKAYIDYTAQRYNEALPAFNTLTQSKKYNTEVPYYIADIHLQQKEYNEASRTAKKYLASYPRATHSTEMKRIAGEAEYSMNHYSEAAALLAEYVNDAEQPQRNALYKLGMSNLHMGVYSQAATNLTRSASQRDALAQNAYLNSGLAHVQLRDMTKARMAFEQASSMDFDKVVTEQALYNYALCIHETSYSGFGESVKVFERFLNEYPNSQYSDQVNDYLIEVYMNTRSYKSALESISKIQRPSTRILEAKQKILYRLGTEAFANSDFEEAISYFNQSLQEGRYNRQTQADAYFWRGESRYKLNLYDEAANDYAQYLATAPSSDPVTRGAAYYNLGYTAFQLKHYPKARHNFEQFINNYRGNASRPMVADAFNRLGDCFFYVRDFTAAERNYAEAVALAPNLGDYSLYQKAFVQGLQKDYTGKIASLNHLIDQHPQSQYVDDALYERGRAYVQLENNTQAIASFQELVRRFPESSLARKAANEIGLIYYQNDRYDEAIAAYKKVIANYPGSEEARLAQRDLKSIYIDLNRIDDYATYASSLKGGIQFDSNERDSLTYIAAEKVYSRGDEGEARKSMNQYLQTFPNGAFQLNAHYYLGLIDYNAKDYNAAQNHFEKVLEYPNNKYSEEAMVLSSEIAFNAKDYQRALTLYKQLKGKTGSAERLLLARTGILRSAHLLQDNDEVIAVAGELLNDSKLSPELANETRYYRAKAALAKGLKEQVAKDLQVLAKDTRNLYGAEAKYRIAEMYYAENNYAQAEKELLNYIEVSTPHAYWLARGFVLLADVYMKTDRELEAKQYLLSLKQNYTEQDDIAAMIESRLAQIKD